MNIRQSLTQIMLAGILIGLVLGFNLPARADTVDVSIQSFAFVPSALTINVGQTVRWTNNQAIFSHTSTADSLVGGIPLWDSGTLTTGQKFSLTFNSPGTFHYHCIFHLTMLGTVTVNVPSCCNMPGDADGNGILNLKDITFLIKSIYQSGPKAPCPAEADANGNGLTNLQDITYLIKSIYQSGPAPVCPA